MSELSLFPLPEPVATPLARPTRPEEARVLRPERRQLQWLPRDLEAAVPEDHPARAIWGLLESLDLSGFYAKIKAVVDRPGHPATDPQVLLALWLLATVDGIGSARRLALMCEAHDAYRWLCGGVPVNYHMLADFRVAHQAALDDLLSQIVACLTHAGAVSLERVAQDGLRVRASAGAASFRRSQTLEGCLREAQAQVERLAWERDHPDPSLSRRQEAARERAARQREERIKEALASLPAAQAAKDRQQRNLAKPRRERISEPRVSTTDPEAKVMKMPDGGFRPAYNAQFATDSAQGVIVAVGVVATGNDFGQAGPIEAQVERRTGAKPKAYLMDGGFAARQDITDLESRDITVYAPVRLPRNKPEAERYEPGQGDSPEVIAWRQRMAGAEAKAVYRQRGAVAEWANAQVRLHGVSQFTVRGLTKVTTVILLTAVAHNLLRWISFTT